MDPLHVGLKTKHFLGLLKVLLYLGYFRLFWVGGRVAEVVEIITNSAKLGLDLGLSWVGDVD